VGLNEAREDLDLGLHEFLVDPDLIAVLPPKYTTWCDL
jgi:hypothetical protein